MMIFGGFFLFIDRIKQKSKTEKQAFYDIIVCDKELI